MKECCYPKIENNKLLSPLYFPLEKVLSLCIHATQIDSRVTLGTLSVDH